MSVIAKWIGPQAFRKNYEIIALAIPVFGASAFAVYKMSDKLRSDQDLRIRNDGGHIDEWDAQRSTPSVEAQVKATPVWKARGL